MIYQDPLAYLLGLEGIALLDAWAGTMTVNSSMPGWPRSGGCWMTRSRGTGRFAEFLATRGHQVIGVDSSPDMLVHARRRVPDGEFHVAATYRHRLGDYLRATLSVGFQLRQYEEPTSTGTGEPLPVTGVGDWQY